jgi:hypothetical protein
MQLPPKRLSIQESNFRSSVVSEAMAAASSFLEGCLKRPAFPIPLPNGAQYAALQHFKEHISTTDGVPGPNRTYFGFVCLRFGFEFEV